MTTPRRCNCNNNPCDLWLLCYLAVSYVSISVTLSSLVVIVDTRIIVRFRLWLDGARVALLVLFQGGKLFFAFSLCPY